MEKNLRLLGEALPGDSACANLEMDVGDGVFFVEIRVKARFCDLRNTDLNISAFSLRDYLQAAVSDSKPKNPILYLTMLILSITLFEEIIGINYKIEDLSCK